MYRNIASVKELCIKMGLAPVDGSYEKALALNVGATTMVNNSWLQAAYPILVAKREQLINQTYPGISVYGQTQAELLNLLATDNMYGYAYNSFPQSTDGVDYPPMGLFKYTDLDGFQRISTDIISYFDNYLFALLNINTVDEQQTTNITTAQASITTLQTNVTNLSTQVNTALAPTYNNTPSVTLNTSNQLSTTKRTRVSYTISIATALSLLNLNSNGQAFLEISADGVTWVTINSAGSNKTLAVGISVGLNDTSYYNVQGEVPVGWRRRIRTTTSGGATVAFVSGQEVAY